MAKKLVINKGNPGVDSLKGGIFFDSSLIPNGSFLNVPQFIESDVPTNSTKDASLVLTLERIKEELQKSAKTTQGSQSDVLTDDNINSFLSTYVQLLIDYSDLRNFTFFGSSYTEMNYNIKYIIENFPIKSYVAKDFNLSGHPEIEIIPLSGNRTQIIFNILDVEEGASLPFKENQNFNWNNYEFVDGLGKRYPIEGIISPYNEVLSIVRTPNLFSGKDKLTINTQDPHNYTSNSIIELLIIDSNGGIVVADKFKVNVTTSTQFELLEISNDRFKVSQIILGDPVKIVTDKPHFYSNNDHIVFYDMNINSLIGNEYIIGNVTDNTFDLFHLNGVSVDGTFFPSGYDGKATSAKIFKLNTSNTFTFNSGYTRFAIPENANAAYNGNYKVTFIVKGSISKNNLVEYTKDAHFFKGLIISPTLQVITDFDVKIDQIQKAILYQNPVPWPVEPVTSNIITTGNVFENWLQNPNNMTRADMNDLGLYQLDANDPGLNLASSLALDENYTNQIVRRAFPQRLIDELRDADDGYFRRFILVAAKMFDVTKTYIDFLKYVYHIDYGKFNQLSPEYYNLYADLYNFNLVSSEVGDGVEFSLKSQETSQQTLKSLRYERQKKLLLNLLYLYKTKGVQACVKYLAVGIGLPPGLIRLEEFIFEISDKDVNGYSPFMFNTALPIKGNKKIDNEKVYVPEIQFEVDPQYTKIDFASKWGITLPIELVKNFIFFNEEGQPPRYSVFSNEFIPSTGSITLAQYVGYQPVSITVYLQNPADLSQIILLGSSSTETPEDSDALILKKLIDNINSRTSITNITAITNDNYKTLSIIIPRTQRRWTIITNGDIIVNPLYSTEIKISYQNPVYRYRLENEEDINLREINILADAQNAVLSDIFDKNKFQSTFGYYHHRNYGNLQKESGDYYLLPLTFPDKYCGIGLRYMIPRDGFKRYLKKDAKNQIDIGSLYQVGTYDYPTFLNGSLLYPPFGERSKALIVFDNFTFGSIQIRVQDGGPQNISDVVNFNTDEETTLNDLVNDINSFVSSYHITAEKIEGQNAIILYGPYANPNAIAGFVIDITGTLPIKAQSEFSTIDTENIYNTQNPFLIARMENGHLVVRARLNDENGIISIPEERIAIFQNLFIDDGLIHQLKLNYRPLGVEIFQDNKFLGVAKWIDPAPNFTIQVDYRIIIDQISNNTANYSKLDSLFATPPTNISPDAPRWWDLYTGNPFGCDFYFESIQVYESLAINYPNPTFLDADLEGNNESEIYNFKFSNNLVDDLHFEIPVQFRQFELNSFGAYSILHYIPTDLPDDKISTINLWNKKYDVLNSNYPLGVEIIKSIPDFYRVPELEILDENTIFKYNAWCKTVHKDYEYSKLKTSLQNYYALYANTITYQDLLPFVDTVDNKFRNLIKDFIPIVINIFHFGKLISNNIQNLPKIHYPSIHKICNGQVSNNGSFGYFKIQSGLSGLGNDVDVRLLNANISLTGGPLQYQGTRFITAQNMIDTINLNFSPSEILASRVGSTIKLKINPMWYYTTYGLDLNEEKFDLVITGNVVLSEIINFSGADFNNITSDCFQMEITNYRLIEDEDQNLYSYYDIEDQASLFVFYDTENVLNFYI